MRLPKRRGGDSLEFNMTPMIDVTFLLIIFFLLSSHLAQSESQVELDLPAARSGLDPEENSSRRVTVNVAADERAGAAPLAFRVWLGTAEVDAAEFERRIRAELRHTDRDGRPLEVRIRCDRGLPYVAVEPLLLACARSGVWKVSFAVTRAP